MVDEECPESCEDNLKLACAAAVSQQSVVLHTLLVLPIRSLEDIRTTRADDSFRTIRPPGNGISANRWPFPGPALRLLLVDPDSDRGGSRLSASGGVMASRSFQHRADCEQ